MSSNVPVAEATRDEAVLPERVQEALGQLVGAARDRRTQEPVGEQVETRARSTSKSAVSRSAKCS